MGEARGPWAGTPRVKSKCGIRIGIGGGMSSVIHYVSFEFALAAAEESNRLYIIIGIK